MASPRAGYSPHMEKVVAGGVLVLTYFVLGIALVRQSQSMAAQERSLLEVELLAALDEVETQRALLNAEFARPF